MLSRDVSVLQPDSAQYCHRTSAKVPFRITCEHAGLETVCSRAMCAPVLLCKELVVLARPLRDHCRQRSVPDMPSNMRCLCHTLVLRTSEPVCMHCMPKSCPNAADAGRLERDHAPRSTELSFLGALTAAGAARAARGSGHIILQDAGTADRSPAGPPAHPPADPVAPPSDTANRMTASKLRYTSFLIPDDPKPHFATTSLIPHAREIFLLLFVSGGTPA